MARVKVIGKSGQISLGKEHAGKSVIVDEIRPGEWIIETGKFVVDSGKLDSAFERVSKNEPKETNLDEFQKRIEQSHKGA